jgi:DNA-cytosine methyltransferase
MRAISLFSGCGGLDLGAHAAGIATAAFCEIDRHAAAVLHYHWPLTPIVSDVCTIRGFDYGPIDLVHGGAPCQDLSMAGMRKGFEQGKRSILVYEQLRVWDEAQAPYLLWENVPGALSSKNGRDFAALLSAIVGATIPVPAGGWSTSGVAAGPTAVAAWRLLHLEAFGVPQSRPRIVVLAARAGGADPAEILALSHDGPHAISPCLEARQAHEPHDVERRAMDDSAREAGEMTLFDIGEYDFLSCHVVDPPFESTAPRVVSQTQLVGAFQLEGTQTASVMGPFGLRLQLPIERERLMGWPDDHTRYGRKPDGTVYEVSDQQRYRMTGNGVGLEWGEWICRRLALAHEALIP